MSRHATVLLISCTLLFGACDSRTALGPLEARPLTGVWSGRVEPAFGSDPQTGTIGTFGGAVVDSLRLAVDQDTTGRLSGSAVIARNGDLRVYRIDGENDFPEVIMTLDPGATFGTELLQVQGEFVSTESVRARIVGGGFAGERILLLHRRAPIF